MGTRVANRSSLLVKRCKNKHSNHSELKILSINTEIFNKYIRILENKDSLDDVDNTLEDIAESKII